MVDDSPQLVMRLCGQPCAGSNFPVSHLLAKSGIDAALVALEHDTEIRNGWFEVVSDAVRFGARGIVAALILLAEKCKSHEQPVVSGDSKTYIAWWIPLETHTLRFICMYNWPELCGRNFDLRAHTRTPSTRDGLREILLSPFTDNDHLSREYVHHSAHANGMREYVVKLGCIRTNRPAHVPLDEHGIHVHSFCTLTNVLAEIQCLSQMDMWPEQWSKPSPVGYVRTYARWRLLLGQVALNVCARDLLAMARLFAIGAYVVSDGLSGPAPVLAFSFAMGRLTMLSRRTKAAAMLAYMNDCDLGGQLYMPQKRNRHEAARLMVDAALFADAPIVMRNVPLPNTNK
jgi:hypothetical protein